MFLGLVPIGEDVKPIAVGVLVTTELWTYLAEAGSGFLIDSDPTAPVRRGADRLNNTGPFSANRQQLCVLISPTAREINIPC